MKRNKSKIKLAFPAVIKAKEFYNFTIPAVETKNKYNEIFWFYLVKNIRKPLKLSLGCSER